MTERRQCGALRAILSLAIILSLAAAATADDDEPVAAPAQSKVTTVTDRLREIKPADASAGGEPAIPAAEKEETPAKGLIFTWTEIRGETLRRKSPQKPNSADIGPRESNAAVPAEKAAGDHPIWAEGLAEGRKQAAQSGRPLLVRVGAPWCGWCTKLHDELEKAEVEQELRRWSLAYVDADDSPGDARQLGVGPIPALRALNASGKMIAEQDGYMPAEPLLAWLKSSYGDATGFAPEMLLATGPPTADGIAKLVESLGESDVARREAAMRRLLPHRAGAGASVAGALRHKKLAVRLASLELLDLWHAPVDGLDPWRPETLTAGRLKSVDDWAGAVGDAPAEAAELSPAQLAEAREQLARLAAASDEDADAIAERLARFGPRLSGVVSAMLKEAAADRDRQRLLALRYRLVASDALALNWPSGVKRLASGEVKVRRAAAEELVAHATAADEPLLSEIFSDPDPLVREISLRGLQAVGGDKAGSTLLRLLADPDPNVRAAVLKQLAEEASADYVKPVAEYALQEPDADLVLHAVRYLKEAGGSLAVPPLLRLLEHPSWQVRAEAVEALTKKTGRHSSAPADEARAAEIYAAFIALLSDDDGFVVSRAVEGLRSANLVAAARPLAAAAEKHPELAAEIIAMLVQSDPMRAATQSTLRKFAEHKDPRVRAGALAGLIAAGEDSQGELAVAGLNDPDPAVARDVAESIFKICQQMLEQKNQGGQVDPFGYQPPGSRFGAFGNAVISIFGGGAAHDAYVVEKKADESKDADESEEQAANPAEAWLIGFHAGAGRPKWMLKTVEPLQKMLVSKNAPERLAAALPLTALGHGKQTLPVLVELTRAEGVQPAAVAPALPWLLWPARETLFNDLTQRDLNDSQMRQCCERLAASRDPRVAALLWKLLARPDASATLAASVYSALNELSAADKSAEKERLSFAAKGAPWQRDIALGLMLNDRETVDKFATEILDDPQTAEDFRVDALQLLLFARGPQQGEKLAVERLGSADPRIARFALMYLVHGADSIAALRDAVHLNASSHVYQSSGSGVAIEVEPPAGLKEEVVRKLLASGDAETVAGAGYLLATLHKADGLDALIAQWRKEPSRRERWSRALYRAIAAVNDDARTPILRDINDGLDSWSKREFYWTIRSMQGAEILKLRKEIRDSVGMDNLR